MTSYAGRTLHASLHLLDRQVVRNDDGRPLAKADDLELDLERDPPVVTAILTGPQAWGPRLPEVLRRLVRWVSARLGEHSPEPGRISFGLVTDVDSAIHVAFADTVHVADFGQWVDERIVSRIPGADHAPQ